MIKNHYDAIIDQTADMAVYARWKKDIYPTADMMKQYINDGAMYLLMSGSNVAGSMAITMEQGEDYHDIHWNIENGDDEVAVIHMLGVNPAYQKIGVGELLIDEAIRLAKDCGKKAIRLDALATNIPAQHLYTKKGFQYIDKKNLYAENTGWTDFYFYELGL